MANILAQYVATQNEMLLQVAGNELPMESVVEYQELNYRIDVLNTCKALTITAPVTTDAQKLGYHYQLTDKVLGTLTTEHKFGPSVDEEGKKKREASLSALERVIQDGRRRFQSLNITSNEQYKKLVISFIGAVLNVWIQYRNTYVNI